VLRCGSEAENGDALGVEGEENERAERGIIALACRERARPRKGEDGAGRLCVIRGKDRKLMDLWCSL